MPRKLILREGLIDFCSNDYLGLARSQILIERLGSTGSRLLTGNSREAEDLEKDLAFQYGYKAALLFNCGYMANLGLLSILRGTILYDAHVHASMKEGMKLSQADAFPFRHNDLDHLHKRLQIRKGPSYICIESIYSTDGSMAPLEEIFALAYKYGAHLIVDEAHAAGVYGKGLVSQPIFAKIVTFGKAFGTFGALVLCEPALKEQLIQRARSFIYTTALPHYALKAIEEAHRLLPTLEKEREHLFRLIRLMGFSQTPIQPMRVGGEEAAQKLSLHLACQGFDVRPLTSPTVKRGSEICRICLHAFNSETEVKKLKEALL